jgi:hypothetical protein
MRIQAIYLDGRVWEGATELPETRVHELSAALVNCERDCLVYRALNSSNTIIAEWIRSHRGWISVRHVTHQASDEPGGATARA